MQWMRKRLIDTAEGAHAEVENILQRMRELAVQASNDTNATADRSILQEEFDQLHAEINRISAATTWAGQNLLDGSGGTAMASIISRLVLQRRVVLTTLK